MILYLKNGCRKPHIYFEFLTCMFPYYPPLKYVAFILEHSV